MLKKIAYFLSRIQLAFGLINISVFFLAVILQVFGRYFGLPVPWTGELSTYNFIWAVFMGAGVMVYERQHFAFDFLITKLSVRLKLILTQLNNLLILSFLCAVFFFGIKITFKFWNYTLINLDFIKMGYVWLSLPIFGGFSAYYVICDILEQFVLKKRG